jgi:hypothetical protein
LTYIAYYWDYKTEVDADMQRHLALAQQQRQMNEPSPIAAKLRAEDLL